MSGCKGRAAGLTMAGFVDRVDSPVDSIPEVTTLGMVSGMHFPRHSSTG